jgi:hypothetical protein
MVFDLLNHLDNKILRYNLFVGLREKGNNFQECMSLELKILLDNTHQQDTVKDLLLAKDNNVQVGMVWRYLLR